MNENEAFAHKYNDIVAMLLTPVVAGDGESEERIAIMEELLDLKLPPLLRDHYLRVGCRKDIGDTHNRLLPPDDVYVDQGYLVFYEENQVVCIWGLV